MSSDPGGQGDAPSRSELQLERQALRNDWPIPPDTRRKILDRLVSYLDVQTEEGSTAPDRTVLMAARTLAQFARLTVDQQRLDLEQARTDRGEDLDPADLVAEAEQRAAERKLQRQTDGPAGGVL